MHAEVERRRSDLSKQFTTIQINDQHPEVLRLYLKKIIVQVVNCYVDWDWNHSSGFVGTSEDELIDCLRKKLRRNFSDEFDEIHLVVYGSGPTVGSYIGYISPGMLNSWDSLNAALDQSTYDIVAILNYGESCIWRRCQGWSDLR